MYDEERASEARDKLYKKWSFFSLSPLTHTHTIQQHSSGIGGVGVGREQFKKSTTSVPIEANIGLRGQTN